MSHVGSFFLIGCVVIASKEYYGKERHKYEHFLSDCTHLIIYRITFLVKEYFLVFKINLNFNNKTIIRLFVLYQNYLNKLKIIKV